ncbi:MAG: CheR family methyltransferase [Clostridium sp.]
MNFEEFHKWVHRELGVNLTAYKPDQLNRRIESLMTRVGAKNLSEYSTMIKTDLEQKQKFLDFITINVTEFFRNPELFKQLEDQLRDNLLQPGKKLKIWSAACSTGCEPYSIAMILNKLTPGVRHTIIATDIDNTILSKAKAGEYIENELKNVPSSDFQKYFEKKDKVYCLSNDIKSKVTFKKHDLILDRYDSEFDLIVCRNVVIYFKTEVKNEIYNKFKMALKPGGLLFVGATESIYNYKEFGFEKISTFIYRKI